MKTWLWPDRTISKQESRILREEHNAVVNSNTELLDALDALLDYQDSVTKPEWIREVVVKDARAAIAKARQ